MELGVLEPSHDVHGRFERRVGLAGKAHDHVGGESQAGEGLLRAFDRLDVLVDPIRPVHGLEDRLVAGLERHVEVPAHARLPRHEVEHLVGKVTREDRRKAQSQDAVDVQDAAEQPHEVALVPALVVPVLPQVHARQDYLARSRRGPGARLG